MGSSCLIEALELLSNSHMPNNLQYVMAQVTLYLVAIARRLRQVNSDSAELPSSRAEWVELRTKVMRLEEEK